MLFRSDVNRKVIVHCHMGVNRGPSLAFAAMLALGHEPTEALAAIRAQRPIAAVLYAEDALRWWHARNGVGLTTQQKAEQRDSIRKWMSDNPVDVAWVINRIRRAGNAA